MLVTRTWWIVLFTVVLIVCGIRYANLNPIHGWSDDGSAYLQHAKNVIAGRSYNYSRSGSTAANALPGVPYPPSVPLILATQIPYTGIDFRSFKITMLVIYGLALLATGFALREIFDWPVAVAVTGMLGVSFELGRLADHINNDFLLLLLLALTILWEQRGSRSLLSQLITAMLMVTMFETRTVAIVVLPALVLYRWWSGKWPIRDIAIGAGLSFAMIFAVVLATHDNPSYLGLLSRLINATTVRRNLIQYPLVLSDLMGGFRPIALLLDVLAFYGTWKLFREGRRSFWLVIVALYLPVIVLWPFSDPVRFSLPFLPVLMGLAIYGAQSFAKTALARNAILGVFMLAFAATQAKLYASTEDFYATGINHPQSMELYSAIQRLQRDAFIACRKPRSISLMSGMPALVYPNLEPKDLLRELCATKCTHVVSAPTIFEDDAKFLDPAIRSNPEAFHIVFQNAQFTLYALHKAQCATGGVQ